MEMQTLKKEKNNKRRTILIILAILILLLIFIGVTYSFYSARVKFVNKSQTIIKTNEVSLVYTGVKEITTGDSMIPGDSFTKTFTVENTSDTKTTYNIYMEQITNEFNEDLVFVLSDDNGEVVSETALPETNTGKSYLLKDIEIDGKELQSYTLKIEFKYLDTPQNDYQGKNFKATVGIDANQIETTTTPGIKVDATDSSGNNLNATANDITGDEKEKLLTSLEETGYINSKEDVDALIEVNSDDFDDIAKTTFDVSSIAEPGDTVVILHFDEEKQEWEYIGTEKVDEDGKVTGDFTSYSPVAFVVVKEDGTFENIKKELACVAPKCKDNDSDGVVSLGDLITYDSESFHVYSNDGDTIKMLAQYNLYVGGIYNGTNNTYTSYTTGATNLQNSTMKGYISPEDIRNGTTDFSSSTVKGTNFNSYEGSIVERYVNTYATKLKQKGVNYQDVTLISKEEVDEITNNNLSTGPDWLFTTTYYTKTTSGNAYIVSIFSYKSYSDTYYNTGYFNVGVRPVLVVSTENF